MNPKTITAKVKNNAIGAVVGAGASFWAAKKYAGVSGTWKLVGISLIGAIAGAYAQGAIMAKTSTPKKSDVKK